MTRIVKRIKPALVLEPVPESVMLELAADAQAWLERAAARPLKITPLSEFRDGARDPATRSLPSSGSNGLIPRPGGSDISSFQVRTWGGKRVGAGRKPRTLLKAKGTRGQLKGDVVGGTKLPPPTRSVPIDQTVADLVAQVRTLTVRLDAIERSGVSPTDRDLELARLVAASTQALKFRAAYLLAHAKRADHALLAALDAALLETVPELACWLRKMRGRHGAITIARLPKRYWMVTDTSTDQPVDREGCEGL